MKFIAPEIDVDDADSAERVERSLADIETGEHIDHIGVMRFLAHQTLDTK